MKKFLLVALVLCCISCENNQTEVRYLGKESPKDIIPFDRITHFEYKGHKYIKFEETRGSASVGGIVHDPDCECFEEKKRKNKEGKALFIFFFLLSFQQNKSILSC